MTPEQRADHLQWCREFIDHHCIFRSPPRQLHLVTGDGGLNAWQFYLPVAMLDQEFSYRVGLLFWDRFAEAYEQRPFQICGCASGGALVACAIQAAAYDFGSAVNAFVAKKAAKTYGLGNWLEGVVPDLPVMLVDDVVGSKKTLTTQGERLRGFGLELYPEAFAVASCKLTPPLALEVPGQTITIETLLGPHDFTKPYERYTAKYGREPEFFGSLR